MKPLILLTFCAAAACAQQAAPIASTPWQKLPDTEVITVIDGTQPMAAVSAAVMAAIENAK